MPPELSAAYQHHSLSAPTDDVSNHPTRSSHPNLDALERMNSLQHSQAAGAVGTPPKEGSVYTVGHIPIPAHIIPTALTDPPPPPHCSAGGYSHGTPQSNSQEGQQPVAGSQPPASGSGGGRAVAAVIAVTSSLLALLPPTNPLSLATDGGQKKRTGASEMTIRLPSSGLVASGLMSPRATLALPATLFSTTLGSVMDEYWAPVVVPRPGAVLVFRYVWVNG